MARRLAISLLVLILLLYAALAYGYATRTPAWQVPDEPAHYNYVRQIVKTGKLPVIEMGDWDQPYLNQVRRCNFHPATIGAPADQQNPAYLEACGFDPAIADDIGRLQYEDHQPPLYYLLQAIIYRLTDGDLTAMRVFSALLGSGVILCAWAIVRRLFDGAGGWSLATIVAAFIAFLPQRLSIMAGVSNDSLAELINALVLLSVTYYLTSPIPDPDSLAGVPSSSRHAWRGVRLDSPLTMGLLIGLAFLTKATIYYTAGISGLAILLRWRREGWPLWVAMKHLTRFAIPALAMGLIWWIHGIQTYGGTDILGLQRHDEVVVGQLRTDDYLHNELEGDQWRYWKNLANTTFHSFWGQFGWMALPMQSRFYRILQVALGLTGIGLLIALISSRLFSAFGDSEREILGLFVLSIILVFAQFLAYNRSFVQFQGRYLYPALIPLAFFLAIGVLAWPGILIRLHLGGQYLTVLLVVMSMLAMAGLAWYALHEVIVLLPVWE